MRHAATLATVLSASALAGIVAGRGPAAVLLVALVAVVAVVLAGPVMARAAAAGRPAPAAPPSPAGHVLASRMPARRTPADTEPMADLVAWAWLALCLLPVHNFIQRANAEAVNQVGLEPVVEVTYFGIVGLLAIAILRRLEPDAGSARPPVLLFLLPGWAMVSALWSGAGPYAAARGVEMVVVATLAWATMAIVRADPSQRDRIPRAFVRRFVATTVALAAAGVVFGSVLVPASDENKARFTWVGAHPNGSALVMAIAIVMLLAAGPEVFRLKPIVWGCVIGALTLAMVANHSRGGLLALGAGAVVVLMANGTVGSLWRRTRLRNAAIVLGVVAIAVLRTQLADYALRGRGADSFFSANGRLGLWQIGFDAMRGPFDWLCGLGFGAARTVFVAELPWAKTAHNSILSLLVGLGLVGVVLGGIAVVSTTRAAVAVRLDRGGPVDRALVGFAVALLVSALVSDVMAEPNIGLAGIYLIAALVLPGARSRAQSPTAPNTVSQPAPAGTSANHEDRSSASGPT